MQSKFLKSTTAMVLALAMAAPSPILAQEVTQEELKKQLEEAQQEAEGAVEAVTDETLPAETEAEADVEAEAEAEVAPTDAPQTADTELPPTGDTATGDTEASDAGNFGGTADASADASTDTDAAPVDEAQAEELPATIEQPADAATDLAEETTEEVIDDTTEAAEDTTEAADAATDTAVDTTEEAVEDTATATENVVEDTADTAADTADTTEEASTEVVEEATEAPQDEQLTEEAAPTEAEAEVTQTTEADTEAEAGTEAETTAEASAEPSEETLSGAAPEVQAAQAGAEEGELIEETVTEETARSSSEEFETEVNQEATASAEATEEDDDDGLSTAQKIAIGGLGALAVGALLNNGQRVVSNSGDRVVVDDNGTYRVLKNDDSLLRQPGADVKTYSFSDGSTRTVVTNPNGAQVETIRASDGRVLSRTRILPDGREVVLFDDTQSFQEVTVNDLPQVTDSARRTVDIRQTDEEALRRALQARLANDPGRSFSLSQIRNIEQVRALAPEIEVNTVNFDTGSAVIRPAEAEELAALGAAMRDAIDRNPGEVFLVEGHTDAVGDAGYNLALSDRRAESLALALTEYFDVPPENMVVQGYGESDLKVQTSEAERANRRAAVRRITSLLGQSG